MHPQPGHDRFADDTSVSFVPGRPGDSSDAPAAGDDCPEVKTESPCLLWIDDEMSRLEAEICFLEFHGFRVERAATGIEGLAMARAGGYRGILLDLNLPDLPGLSILATLRAEKNKTPVMVVTGFGDWESARVAGRFGANAFQGKPLSLEDLEIAVRRLVRERLSDSSSSLDAGTDELRASLGWLARLLEVLHVLRREVQPHTKIAGLGLEPKQILLSALIRTLATPELPMAVFLACAVALRRVKASDERQSKLELASTAESLILQALSRCESQDSRVVRALEMVRSAATRHERLALERIAETERVDPAHLGRLIKTDTDFDFTAWRTGFLLRPSLTPLIETSDHVKQIARRHLGYKHESQFDRDFHEFFGLTPTSFRQICRQRE